MQAGPTVLPSAVPTVLTDFALSLSCHCLVHARTRTLLQRQMQVCTRITWCGTGPRGLSVGRSFVFLLCSRAGGSLERAHGGAFDRAQLTTLGPTECPAERRSYGWTDRSAHGTLSPLWCLLCAPHCVSLALVLVLQSEPTAKPSAEPTLQPSALPSAEPTSMPTASPTSIAFCAVYESLSVCTTCESGFALALPERAFCVPAIARCLVHNAQGRCTTCETNYVPRPSDALACVLGATIVTEGADAASLGSLLSATNTTADVATDTTASPDVTAVTLSLPTAFASATSDMRVTISSLDKADVGAAPAGVDVVLPFLLQTTSNSSGQPLQPNFANGPAVLILPLGLSCNPAISARVQTAAGGWADASAGCTASAAKVTVDANCMARVPLCTVGTVAVVAFTPNCTLGTVRPSGVPPPAPVFDEVRSQVSPSTLSLVVRAPMDAGAVSIAFLNGGANCSSRAGPFWSLDAVPEQCELVYTARLPLSWALDHCGFVVDRTATSNGRSTLHFTLLVDVKLASPRTEVVQVPLVASLRLGEVTAPDGVPALFSPRTDSGSLLLRNATVRLVARDIAAQTATLVVETLVPWPHQLDALQLNASTALAGFVVAVAPVAAESTAEQAAAQATPTRPACANGAAPNSLCRQQWTLQVGRTFACSADGSADAVLRARWRALFDAGCHLSFTGFCPALLPGSVALEFDTVANSACATLQPRELVAVGCAHARARATGSHRSQTP